MSVKALPNYVFGFMHMLDYCLGILLVFSAPGGQRMGHQALTAPGLLFGNPFVFCRTWGTAGGTPGPYRPASERALLIVGEATRPCAVAPYVTDPGLNWLCLQIDLLCLVYQHWSTYIF